MLKKTQSLPLKAAPSIYFKRVLKLKVGFYYSPAIKNVIFLKTLVTDSARLPITMEGALRVTAVDPKEPALHRGAGDKELMVGC